MNTTSDDEKFDVVFSGQIANGFIIDDVKQKLSQLFKIDSTKVDKLFQAESVVLKKSLSESAALQYQKVLLQNGMVVSLKSQSKPKVAVKSDNSGFDDLGTYSSTLSPTDAKTSVKTNAEYNKADNVVESSESSPDTEDLDEWQIAKVGARLSEQTKKVSPNIPDSDLTLAPQDGDLLRAEEKAKPVVTEVNPLDDVSLSAIGDDLLKASEKIEIPEVSVNTDHLSVSEAAGDLLKPEEKKIIAPKDIDTSAIQLQGDK